MSDNKENVPPTDQVLESSHGKNSGKQVANQKVERIVAEAEDKAIESDSNSQVLSDHEGDDIVEVEAPTDSDSQEKGEAGDDINAEANKTYAEMVKAPKLFNKAEKQRNPFKDLQEKIGESFDSYDIGISYSALPETLFGIPTNETGSATFGVQLVVFADMQNMTNQMAEMVKTNNIASGHVQSIKDMMHTITEAEKQGNRAWKKNTEMDLKEKMAELKKEHALQQAEQDRKIRELQSLLVAERKTEEIESGGGAGRIPKKAQPAAKKGANKAIKRPSSTKADEAAAKLPRAESTVAGMSMTLEQKLNAALARKQEKAKKKTTFSCIFCQTNNHASTGCQSYPNTKERKIRMIELGICMVCGKGHGGLCRFQFSRDSRERMTRLRHLGKTLRKSSGVVAEKTMAENSGNEAKKRPKLRKRERALLIIFSNNVEFEMRNRSGTSSFTITMMASNTTLAAKDTNVEMAEIHAERHNSPMLESVWSEKLERSDSSNTDESPMKPTNADAVTANHIGAQFPAEWKTRREIKDEAVFRFLNWAKKLGDEDKDKKAEEKEKELAEIAETRFLENKQKFRSLLIEREFSAEEWTLMKQFLDYPELAAIVVKMRRSQGVPGLRQNRRRCLTCEESLAGMPLTAHKTEHCSIPYESRILVSKRLFGQRKCYGCGRMKEDGNCNCKSVPCRRCWRWNVPESFPHLQVMGTCQMVWKIRQETGHVPTEHEISDFTKRNDKIASIIQHKLEKFVAETERELVDAGRASNQKTEA
ncbi:hypothetical protein L5515_003442 [Caenorhabditis briggsae]|uniref:Uncharacterized protein n=1 Tax=Caenorhabditis briggsae TaxID=6238 RepID=A0AAE9EIK7_CAEBR|nr:hypothetical protein L5515_003442 [Caenorhabditis briggsae]